MNSLGKVGNYQRVKENKTYPWPCWDNADRTIEIFTDDVLTRTKPGIFTCQTGICKTNILIPEKDIIETSSDNHLVLL